jgi:DNA-binding MarR family transcriptional regulator
MPAQVAALIEIGRAEGLTQKDLVERLDVEQPGVARTLNGLEADGWITRQALAGRSQGLYLTDRARAVLPEASRLSAEINRQALSELSRTEQAHLIDRLGEIVAALKSA